MKIIQITDTHFSPTKPHFNSNWAPLLEWIESQNADLIIHTGDLSVDGADHAQDLTFCMDLMRQVSVPMLIVPGNHDVGHAPDSRQPVNAERLARWRDNVGPDYFVHDQGEWSFIGLNSLAFGHGNAEEQEQFEWLEATLAARSGKRFVIFSHQPLFIDDENEGDTGYWSIKPDPRQRLYRLLNQYNVALFASGHIHWAWQGKFGQTNLTWGPSAAFVIDTLERPMPGTRTIGAAVHTLGETVTTEIVSVPNMTAFYIDDVIDEVYPQSAAKEVEVAQ